MAAASIAPGTLEGTPEQRQRARELRELVLRSVEDHPAESILLSGGLDTSILAWVAAPRGLRQAVTVLVGDDAPDQEHAVNVARARSLEHHPVRTDLVSILEEVPFVVRVMRTFDPMEVRNSIVVARGLREVRRLGLGSTMTGDAADELFGGYSFLWGKSEEEFQRASGRMAASMQFSSGPMGKALGVAVQAPYLDPRIVAFSLGLPRADKVVRVGGETHGKYLLRLAFPEVENRWRRKDPIEVGSGSTRLPASFRARIPPEDLEREQRRILSEDQVEIRDAEHLAYYREFVAVRHELTLPKRFGALACPKCGYALPTPSSDFCFTCGAWPVKAGPG